MNCIRTVPLSCPCFPRACGHDGASAFPEVCRGRVPVLLMCMFDCHRSMAAVCWGTGGGLRCSSSGLGCGRGMWDSEVDHHIFRSPVDPHALRHGHCLVHAPPELMAESHKPPLVRVPCYPLGGLTCRVLSSIPRPLRTLRLSSRGPGLTSVRPSDCSFIHLLSGGLTPAWECVCPPPPPPPTQSAATPESPRSHARKGQRGILQGVVVT